MGMKHLVEIEKVFRRHSDDSFTETELRRIVGVRQSISKEALSYLLNSSRICKVRYKMKGGKKAAYAGPKGTWYRWKK